MEGFKYPPSCASSRGRVDFVEMIIPQIVQKENSVPHRQKVKGNEGKKKSAHTAKGQRGRKIRSMSTIFLKKP